MSNSISQNLRLRVVLFAIYFGGATLLVMGHSLDDLDGPPISDVPTVSAARYDTSDPAWALPYKKPELEALPPGQSFSLGSTSEIDAADILPAWGMFTAVVGLFFFLYAHSDPIILHFIPIP